MLRGAERILHSERWKKSKCENRRVVGELTHGRCYVCVFERTVLLPYRGASVSVTLRSRDPKHTLQKKINNKFIFYDNCFLKIPLNRGEFNGTVEIKTLKSIFSPFSIHSLRKVTYNNIYPMVCNFDLLFYLILLINIKY